jgi:tetratricopeptide (TPR) repeat protein
MKPGARRTELKRSVKVRVTALSFIIIFAVSCSTAPKNPGEIFELRNRSESQLELGNKEADRSNYETALILLNESKRLAILSDNPSLLIRTGLSRGNVLLALGRTDEAFAEWSMSAAEAESTSNRELAAVTRVHIARGRLLSGRSNAQSVLEEVNREMSAIRSDQLYIAFSWLVTGLCQREIGRYAEAENAVRRSLDIHVKGRYLEQASYDWFVIASIRSLAGNYESALQALRTALDLDRRTENSYGLASDWRAMGDVYKKLGNEAASRQAYLRAATIFRALGSDTEASALEKMVN